MRTLLILTMVALLVYAVTHMLRTATPEFAVAPDLQQARQNYLESLREQH